MPIYDAWTTAFATLGARTTGTRAREYVLAGSGWQGRLPDGMAVVQSPTSLAWILGHLRSDGSRDDEEVRRLQQQIRLTLLSRWAGDPGPDGEAPLPPPAVVASPVAQVSRMDPQEYFGRVARLLLDNPPHRADRARVERMAALGVGPDVPRPGPATTGSWSARSPEAWRTGSHSWRRQRRRRSRLLRRGAAPPTSAGARRTRCSGRPAPGPVSAPGPGGTGSSTRRTSTRRAGR